MSKLMLRILASNIPSYSPGNLLPDDTVFQVPAVIIERIEVPDDTAPEVFAHAGVAGVGASAHQGSSS